MKEFLLRQFDKLLLLTLIIFFTFVAIHIIHDTHDAAVVNWGLTLVSGVVGGLMTLITGAITKATANPSNPIQPEEKKQ